MSQFDAFRMSLGAAGEENDGSRRRLKVGGCRFQVQELLNERCQFLAGADFRANVFEKEQLEAGILKYLCVKFKPFKKDLRGDYVFQAGQLSAGQQDAGAG